MGGGAKGLEGPLPWLSVTLRGEDPTSSPFRPAVEWGENACEGEWLGDGSANERGAGERCGAGREGGAGKVGGSLQELVWESPSPSGREKGSSKI